jgi:hypothetical protein
LILAHAVAFASLSCPRMIMPTHDVARHAKSLENTRLSALPPATITHAIPRRSTVVHRPTTDGRGGIRGFQAGPEYRPARLT